MDVREILIQLRAGASNRQISRDMGIARQASADRGVYSPDNEQRRETWASSMSSCPNPVTSRNNAKRTNAASGLSPDANGMRAWKAASAFSNGRMDWNVAWTTARTASNVGWDRVHRAGRGAGGGVPPRGRRRVARVNVAGRASPGWHTRRLPPGGRGCDDWRQRHARARDDSRRRA